MGLAKGSGLTSELIDRMAVELVGSSEAIPHVTQGGVVGVAGGAGSLPYPQAPHE